MIKWGDYNYDYDEKNSRRNDFSPGRFRFLKVRISEGDKSAEYTLKFNSTKRGLWMGSEPPRVCDAAIFAFAETTAIAKKFYHENPINFSPFLSLDTLAGKCSEEASSP